MQRSSRLMMASGVGRDVFEPDPCVQFNWFCPIHNENSPPSPQINHMAFFLKHACASVSWIAISCQHSRKKRNICVFQKHLLTHSFCQMQRSFASLRKLAMRCNKNFFVSITWIFLAQALPTDLQAYITEKLVEKDFSGFSCSENRVWNSRERT